MRRSWAVLALLGAVGCAEGGITRAPVPMLSISVREVDFGPVPQRSAVTRTIDVQNSANGSDPLEITGIAVEPSTAGFSLMQVYQADGAMKRSLSPPFTIPAQHTRYLVLGFEPPGEGDFTARIRFSASNAGNRTPADFVVHIKGAGVEPRVCTECARPPARRCLSTGESLVHDPAGFCPDGRCAWSSRVAACATSCVAESGVCEGESIFHELRVVRSGCEGRITSDVEGIDCGADCSERFVDGAVVTLTATAARGCGLARWSGACSGNAGCAFTVHGPRVVGATFELDQLAVSVEVTGSSRGAIVSDPPGITCRAGTCTARFDYGREVVLTATSEDAAGGFQGWSGACSGFSPECRFVVERPITVSGRFGPPECGNDLLERGEVCDGIALMGMSCRLAVPERPDGELRCASGCTGLDTSGCHRCGDGRKDGPEVCDGDDLGGLTCAGETGLPNGALRCKSDCSGVESNTCYRCGDGRLQGPEVCDGTNLGGQSCITAAGRQSGVLGCHASCLAHDTSACFTCGDGMIERGEVCDGANLAGQTCATMAAGAMGMLACAPDCRTYDATRCSRCGDGRRSGPEECDASDLGGQSCGALGFSGGTLYCDSSCTLDTSACASCGDGVCDTARGENAASCPDECAWARIAGDEWTTCGGLADGSLHCWGENQLGSFGIGRTPANSPTPIRLGLTTTTSFDYGRYKACAVSAGDVWCWGDNSAGELGIGNRTGPDPCGGRPCSPIPVRSLTGAIAVAAGQEQTCAIRNDQSVWCWGGTLGDRPVQIPGIASAIAIGAGYGFACALRSDGVVLCFGRNGRGNLGDGTITPSAMPVPAIGMSGVRSISVGHETACAVKNDGTAWCWGRGSEGQIGDGFTVDRPMPVQVRLPDIASISTGTLHACAAKRDGSAWCWGRGTEGQLGDGMRASSPLAVRVQGLAGATFTLAASPASRGANEGHSCAIASGELWCWGFGGNGELGARLPSGVTSTAVPVRVTF